MTQLKESNVKQKTYFLTLERGMDTYSCFFLVAGILYALYKPLVLGPDFPWAFAYLPALLLLPIFLFDRRLLIALTACAAIFLLFCYISDVQWVKTTVEFIRWWASGFTPMNADFFYYYYVAVRLLLAVTITLGLWLLIRRHPPFWLLLIGCPGVVAVLAYLGLRGFVPSMYMLAAGLAPLGAAATVKRNSQARGLAAACAIPLTALVLGASFLILPADTSGLRLTPLGEKVEEWRETARVYYWGWRTRNEPMTAFDLSEEYYAKLGGPIEPGHTRMLLINTDRPMLLKGSVYDYYTGNGWQKGLRRLLSSDNNYSSISGNAIDFQDESAADDLDSILGTIPQPDSNHPLAPFVRSFSTEITLLHPQEPRLFYGGRPLSFNSNYNIEPFVEYETELRSRLPLNNGYSYELSGLMLDREGIGFAAAMSKASQQQNAAVSMELQQPSEATQDINMLYMLIMENYRNLPASFIVSDGFIPTRKLVLDIANKGLTEGEDRSPYEQAVLLESWLRDNCTYTLTPQMPPENEDFVLHFLDTREGYCTYYASAMVIMSRLINIRARYVTGYALSPTQNANQYEATQATAHAWAELYFDGVGWLPFDPTGMEVINNQDTDIPTGSGQIMGEPLHWAMWGNTDNTTAADRDTDYHTLWPTVLILVLASLLAILLMIRRAWLAYRLPKLLKHFPPATVLDIYYSDLLEQLVVLGWQRRPGETILRFMHRMGAYLPKQELQLQELSSAVCDWRYGGLPPDENSLLNAAALHEHFENILKRQLKNGRYCAYRIRHVPKKLITRHP